MSNMLTRRQGMISTAHESCIHCYRRSRLEIVTVRPRKLNPRTATGDLPHVEDSSRLSQADFTCDALGDIRYWCDATTTNAVLSLLEKKPVPLPSINTGNADSKAPKSQSLMCVSCLEPLPWDLFPELPITQDCDHTSAPGSHICLKCLRRSLDV
ncbi:hypothetical protein M432DRAFT_476834 [Thermoascus aurantiacus ATCC 26904]